MTFWRNERNNDGLKRKILELDLVEAWVRTRMNNKACGFGSNGNFEGRHNADEEVVRVVA